MKTWEITWKVLCVALVSMAAGLLLMGSLFAIVLYVNTDKYVYRDNIQLCTKEEVITFVKEHEAELDVLAQEMETLRKDMHKNSCDIRRGQPQEEQLNITYEILSTYSIKHISAAKMETYMEEETDAVALWLAFKTKDCAAWGICHMANGEAPLINDKNASIEEQDNKYIQTGNGYIREAERITGKWYYFVFYDVEYQWDEEGTEAGSKTKIHGDGGAVVSGGGTAQDQLLFG